MNRTIATVAFCSVGSVVAFAQPGQLLTGDTRLACEARMCLSSGQPPHECDPALQRYFSIKHKKLSDTIKARQNFLNLCPMASSSSASAGPPPAHAAGRCDAAALNDTNLIGAADGSISISDAMPSYCTAYAGPGYTSTMALPIYVGDSSSGGHWINPPGSTGTTTAPSGSTTTTSGTTAGPSGSTPWTPPPQAVGRCDVSALNDTNLIGAADGSIYISNAMPSYCAAYAGATNAGALPVFVGDPVRGGYWVDPAGYNEALRDYNARGGYGPGPAGQAGNSCPWGGYGQGGAACPGATTGPSGATIGPTNATVGP